jgi:hypothetical protein
METSNIRENYKTLIFSADPKLTFNCLNFAGVHISVKHHGGPPLTWNLELEILGG